MSCSLRRGQRVVMTFVSQEGHQAANCTNGTVNWRYQVLPTRTDCQSNASPVVQGFSFGSLLRDVVVCKKQGSCC